jgi:hypothetical protein
VIAGQLSGSILNALLIANTAAQQVSHVLDQVFAPSGRA